MRFWDTSAIVPLCILQPASPRSQSLYEEDPDMIVWWSAPVECMSAFARLRREGRLDESGERLALEVLDALWERWREVNPSQALREQARRVLRIHSLTASDALHLAAALDWSGVPASGAFVTFDDRLAGAARDEGFTVHGRAQAE